MINRRAFLKAFACTAAVAATGVVSSALAQRLERWLPWTRMTALDAAGREWSGVACRDGRAWLARVEFRESAAIVGCRTPLGSYRWFAPIRVTAGDAIEFNFKVDVDLPDELPNFVPAGWRDLKDQGPRRI